MFPFDQINLFCERTTFWNFWGFFCWYSKESKVYAPASAIKCCTHSNLIKGKILCRFYAILHLYSSVYFTKSKHTISRLFLCSVPAHILLSFFIFPSFNQFKIKKFFLVFAVNHIGGRAQTQTARHGNRQYHRRCSRRRRWRLWIHKNWSNYANSIYSITPNAIGKAQIEKERERESTALYKQTIYFHWTTSKSLILMFLLYIEYAKIVNQQSEGKKTQERNWLRDRITKSKALARCIRDICGERPPLDKWNDEKSER